MAREIRISIDDDEVFERMKARKSELDLSWEEVLHRGLRHDEEQTERDDPSGYGAVGRGRDRPRGVRREVDEPRPRDPISDPGGFAEDLKRQIQGQVRESLHASLDPDPLARDVESLESAEDAVLVFDFLDEHTDPALQVPLRVTLEARVGGLEVDVVAVRTGKSTVGMNAFDPPVRRRIVEGLAAGEPATLRFEAGEESYEVAPVLSWSRDGGVPTVSDVTIEEVRFDDR